MKAHIGRSALFINAAIAAATLASKIILPNIFSYVVIISGLVAIFTFSPKSRLLGIILSYISLIASVCITSLAVWTMLRNPSPSITGMLLSPLVISIVESLIAFVALICWAGIPKRNSLSPETK